MPTTIMTTIIANDDPPEALTSQNVNGVDGHIVKSLIIGAGDVGGANEPLEDSFGIAQEICNCFNRALYNSRA